MVPQTLIVAYGYFNPILSRFVFNLINSNVCATNPNRCIRTTNLPLKQYTRKCTE
uniref:Uncharacterized protein n=1 Tax=Helianthus annuus TaxID=4232 RepID=A0A251SBI5_HELAN